MPCREPVRTEQEYRKALQSALRHDEAELLIAGGLSADLADLELIAESVTSALAELRAANASRESTVEHLKVLFDQLVIHAPFHLNSLERILSEFLAENDASPFAGLDDQSRRILEMDE